jgi:hypothetical protein
MFVICFSMDVLDAEMLGLELGRYSSLLTLDAIRLSVSALGDCKVARALES